MLLVRLGTRKLGTTRAVRPDDNRSPTPSGINPLARFRESGCTFAGVRVFVLHESEEAGCPEGVGLLGRDK